MIGLLLAALGLHSVMFVLVRSRFREIGIRMALGGQPREVVSMILGHSLRVMSVGLVAGILCAIVLSRVTHSMCWNVSAADPVTFLGSTVLLMLAGRRGCGGERMNACASKPKRRKQNSDSQPLVGAGSDRRSRCGLRRAGARFSVCQQPPVAIV